MAVKWSLEETEQFLRYARHSLNAQERASFERSLRLEADSCRHRQCRDGTEQVASQPKEDSDHCHRFQKGQDDVIGKCVDELWNSDQQFAVVVQEALENAVNSYERVKEKGLKDGLKLSQEVDRNIMSTAWKQSFTKSLIKASSMKIQEQCRRRATDGSLCAMSGMMPLAALMSVAVEDYSTLEPEVIRNLMTDGIGVQNRYAGVNTSSLTRELEFIQYNGAFNLVQDANSVYEGCSVLWMKPEHLSPEHQKETLAAVKNIKCLPFELCKRCKLMLQVMSFLRVVLMSNEGAKIKRHQDSLEAGVMFTVLYVASLRSEGPVHLKVNAQDKSMEIKLEPDMLILLKYVQGINMQTEFRSNVFYEINPFSGKMFIISSMITGAQ
ncbi:hypothetical protein BgAZ_500750 [Babesia gibsoni]|uniref:Uncharacterized protein n=1 Tax=Babesia gibsoni TaxID=33632 RepID=A0AAD8LLQ3_BABGI|nr:hypothetical protein BgAZ_500750 [Babesia gibsoni]